MDYLRELILTWSKWHASKFPEEYRPPDVRSGTIRMSPYSVQGLGGKGGEILIMEDLPAPPSKRVSLSREFNVEFERTGDVPVYDRAIDFVLLKRKRKSVPKKTTALLKEQKGHTENEKPEETTLSMSQTDVLEVQFEEENILLSEDDEGSLKTSKRLRLSQRCFNCGSYAHGVKDCFHVIDQKSIEENRRDMMGMKESFRSLPKRYFLLGRDGSGKGNQVDEKGNILTPRQRLEQEFPECKPGVLTLKTKKALGIGDKDPPPWLARMQLLGLPPMYSALKDEQNSKASEVQISSRNATAPQVNGTTTRETISTSDPSLKCDEKSLHMLEDKYGYRKPSSSQEEGEVGDNDEVVKEKPSSEFPVDAISEQKVEANNGGLDENVSQKPLENFIGFESIEPDSEGQDGRANRMSVSEKIYVEFPGINAPIPEGANQLDWGSYDESHGRTYTEGRRSEKYPNAGRRNDQSYSSHGVERSRKTYRSSMRDQDSSRGKDSSHDRLSYRNRNFRQRSRSRGFRVDGIRDNERRSNRPKESMYPYDMEYRQRRQDYSSRPQSNGYSPSQQNYSDYVPGTYYGQYQAGTENRSYSFMHNQSPVGNSWRAGHNIPEHRNHENHSNRSMYHTSRYDPAQQSEPYNEPPPPPMG